MYLKSGLACCIKSSVTYQSTLGLYFLFYSLEEIFFSARFFKHLVSSVINWIFVKQMGKINIFVLFRFPDVG